ncbi:MAG: ABC transporter substrate-binding protein [Burkholderiales bacterium]|nr:ABC transporter substrate-binding protein [Burkholderiales bacterium]
MRTFTAIAAVVIGAAVHLTAHAQDTIKIGLVNEATGPNAEAGVYTHNGAKLALEEINAAGGVLGKKLELKLEDNQSTNPGTVLAFSKLFGEKGIVATIGPIRSTQVQAASPTIKKAGIPTMIGGTDPSLTKVKNRWLFRGRPSDSYSSKVIADFGVNTLKKQKWAIVHSTDAFGAGGMAALTAALKEHGITPVLVQGYTNNSQDFTPVVLAIKKSGADIIGSYMTNSPDVGIFAKQLRQLGINAEWVGSPSVVTDTAMKLAGPALNGVYGIADFTPDASDESKGYSKKYRETYKQLDPDVYSSWAYDALKILALAINTAKSTDPEAIRKAVVGIKGYKGVEGTYTFDDNGDGLRGYNVVKNDAGKVSFIKHIDFKE